MAYSEEDKEKIFNEIVEEIEGGNSLISTLSTNGMPSTSTFYIWLNEDEEKSKRYAHACEIRELKMLDEIITIADNQGVDVIEKEGKVYVNHNIIERCKIRIDARKWALSKLNPKKYGNKVDVTTDGNSINTLPPVFGDNPLDRINQDDDEPED